MEKYIPTWRHEIKPNINRLQLFQTTETTRATTLNYIKRLHTKPLICFSVEDAVKRWTAKTAVVYDSLIIDNPPNLRDIKNLHFLLFYEFLGKGAMVYITVYIPMQVYRMRGRAYHLVQRRTITGPITMERAMEMGWKIEPFSLQEKIAYDQEEQEFDDTTRAKRARLAELREII